MSKPETADVDALIALLQKRLDTAPTEMTIKDWLAITDRIIKLLAIRQRAGKGKKGNGYNPFATPPPEETPSVSRTTYPI
jgi:hypothetical protein